MVSAPKTLFHFLKHADCIVGMGSSLTRNHWAPQIPNGKTIIHCTNDPADINKEFATEAAILGDAKLVLEALIAEIGTKQRTTDDVAAEVAAVGANGCASGGASSRRPRCRSTSTASSGT